MSNICHRLTKIFGSFESFGAEINPTQDCWTCYLREWTSLNGANNALRINGFGAPRAFFTPVARNIMFPKCELRRRLCHGAENKQGICCGEDIRADLLLQALAGEQ